jgi:hypothetical protein
MVTVLGAVWGQLRLQFVVAFGTINWLMALDLEEEPEQF